MKLHLSVALLVIMSTSALAQSEIQPVPSRREKAADAVQLAASADEVKHCKRVAEVGGRSYWGGGWATVAHSSVMRQLKRKTAEAGGNTLLLLNVGGHSGGANGIGIAYRC